MKILTESPPRHPTRRPEILEAAARLLAEGEWTRLEGAPETEAALREFHGGGEIWWVASGTAALEAILIGNGIGPGDEVITVPYTWGATVSAILAVGGVPVFADVDPETGLIDPVSARSKLTSRTRAVLGVHLFGRPFAARELRAWADDVGILLLEDGSQAHGARIAGRRVGRFGHASAFSCMALKPLGGTEGGYAIFEHPAAAERAYLNGKHPRGLHAAQATLLSEQGLLDSLQLGWRPCTLGAELARLALPFLDEENSGRLANAETLRTLLADVPAIRMPADPPDTLPVHHLMSLVFNGQEAGITRAAFLERLGETGVEAFVYIPMPIHRLRRLNWRNRDVPPIFWHRQLEESGSTTRPSDCRVPSGGRRIRSRWRGIGRSRIRAPWNKSSTRSGLRSGESEHFQQLHFKDERLVRPDEPAGAPFAIGQVGRNEEPDFSALFHILQALGPPRNHAGERKADRLVALVGAVKLGAVEQGAAIVDQNGVARFRRLSRAFLLDDILKPTGRLLDARLLCVFGKECLALLGCSLCHKGSKRQGQEDQRDGENGFQHGRKLCEIPEMTSPDRDLGPQPIAALMESMGLKAHDLVAASTEQITHKMVARACKGRWLTPNVQGKILRALRTASGRSVELRDLFNY